MRRSARLATAVATAVVALVVAASPAWAVPAITVTPDEDLLHGQAVTVTGSGYTPGETIFLVQCTPAPATTSDCDTRRAPSVTPDDTGSFTTTFRVRRIITTPTDGEVDCAAAPGTCVVAAGNLSATEVATAATSFDPSGPLPVPFEITVRDVTAVVRDNEVLLQGTVTCTEPADVFIQGRLRQVVRRRFIDGTFGTSTTCDGEGRFSVVFEGENGVIKPGEAELDLTASGAGFEGSDQFTLDTELRVRAK